MAGALTKTAILNDSNATQGGRSALEEQFPWLEGLRKSLLLGAAPDEVATGSVLDPLARERNASMRAAAEIGYPINTALQVLPGVGSVLKLSGRLLSLLSPVEIGYGAMKGIANGVKNPLLSMRQTGKIEPEFQSSRFVGKDPTPVQQRGFQDDYPQGISGPQGSRLKVDIDGRPLSDTSFIAGRRTVGGADEGLSVADAERASRDLGANRATASSRSLSGDVGRYLTGQGKDGEVYREILLKKGLPESDYNIVFPHEVGHLIEDLTFGRSIPSDGIKDGLDRLYSIQNSQFAVKPGQLGATPEMFGYTGVKSDAERMAEAVRMYMRDPNYMKTEFPDVAAVIRKHVNTNPNLKDVIQFNGGAGASALGMAYEQNQEGN